MTYAQILNGIIINTIILNDVSLVDLFTLDPIDGTPFDHVIRVDNLDPQPSIGWTYDGQTFTPFPGG